jgi:hypothetical protein
MPTPIFELFTSDVTRDIAPVVYFHEQAPERLAAEVGEYIVTGGWPEGHPNRRRVDRGIHEEYVRLLTGIAAELRKPHGPDLPPASWISGFYGSGKSSFAKLLGLALDGRMLPDGRPLADALLARDHSPNRTALVSAWEALRALVDPVAVVFDIGGVARGGEPIHTAVLRQVQKRLGYCPEGLVADFELRLERQGEWARFEETALATLKRPWAEVRNEPLAEEDFSLVMSVLHPEHYTDPMAWYTSRGGTGGSLDRVLSAQEVTRAIGDMLGFRARGKSLFIVVDEVSQYIHQDQERMLALQSFVSELQQRLKGRVWLLVTGQEKLDEAGDRVVLGKMKDRFPERFRVHLAQTNIRDVIHRRLLHKKPTAEPVLRALFDRHRTDLKLFAFDCDAITPEEFVEVYPLLPGHIDLILQITTAMRTRSTRVQGDDQAIRGLLQLLGELFRSRRLAEREVGTLVTLDEIYEIQHTALDTEAQASMARVLGKCDPTQARAAKAVALLELVQETLPTTAELVARCLYDRLDRGNQLDAVTAALESLRQRNLLGYSEKTGYKLQSSSAEEWERERRDIQVPPERRSALVREALKYLIGDFEQAKLQGRPFPWGAWYSDGRSADDEQLQAPRDDAAFFLDFRFVRKGERSDQAAETWLKLSDDTVPPYRRERLLWVCGESEVAEHLAIEAHRSQAMVDKYEPRRESLPPHKKLLLQQEKNAAEEHKRGLSRAVEATFMAGSMYFRGRALTPRDTGMGFKDTATTLATRLLPELYTHFTPIQLEPKELAQLLEPTLVGVSAKLLGGESGLGILELDNARLQPNCTGVVPKRVAEYIQTQGATLGSTLLKHFSRPPFGYPASVVRACVAGLLRGQKLRAQPESGPMITAFRDVGSKDLFDKDRAFRVATFSVADAGKVGPTDRAKICRFFKDRLDADLEREDHAIADAVEAHFPGLAKRLREVEERLRRMCPASTEPSLQKLQSALEACLRHIRQTGPTVEQVKLHLEALNDGVSLLQALEVELTGVAEKAIAALRDILAHQWKQLEDAGGTTDAGQAAAERIREQLALSRPWREVAALDADVATIRQLYEGSRETLINWQEVTAEAARGRVKTREGFETLDADEAHHVLRPIAEASTSTDAAALHPPLEALKAPFEKRLETAETLAHERLDEILDKRSSDGGDDGDGDDDDDGGDGPGPKAPKPPKTPKPPTPTTISLDLGLRNRVVASTQDVEHLLAELRRRLQDQLARGFRVRLR